MNYKKGEWVLVPGVRCRVRVERDQAAEGPEQHLVWCEWEEGHYRVRSFPAVDLTRMKPAGEPAV